MQAFRMLRSKLFLLSILALAVGLSGCGDATCRSAKQEAESALQDMNSKAAVWSKAKAITESQAKKGMNVCNEDFNGKSLCEFRTGVNTGDVLDAEKSALDAFEKARDHWVLLVTTYPRCFDPKVVIQAKEIAG